MQEYSLVALMASMLTLCLSCASTAPLAPNDSQLTAAGFKVVAAKTTQQQEHVQSLAPGTISELQRNGVHFFVYPDAGNNRIYVGTAKEYATYQRLNPSAGSISGSLAQQKAADMASYDKQDQTMRANTNRDLSDPYFFWPSFEQLGW